MQSSLTNATKWLSSTAIRLFSSSCDEMGEKEVQTKEQFTVKSPIVKRGRGRPRKDHNTPKVSKSIPERRELGRRRSSFLNSREIREESGPNDGETRFLLTLDALPKKLQIIAKTLYPLTHNKYEEHRLVCKLLNEDNATKKREIFIPTFKKLSCARTVKECEKAPKEKEMISDEDCLQRHRPLELAERRERRREEELIRYELYIRKLSKEYPELLNRKYPITSDGSLP